MTLTIKIYDGVYAHKDIVEGGKDNKDITSMLRIGKTLKIGEDTFEDLDEVGTFFEHLILKFPCFVDLFKIFFLVSLVGS